MMGDSYVEGERVMGIQSESPRVTSLLVSGVVRHNTVDWTHTIQSCSLALLEAQMKLSAEPFPSKDVRGNVFTASSLASRGLLVIFGNPWL